MNIGASSHGVNPIDLRLHVVRPALTDLGLLSQAAEDLVLGTAACESDFRDLDQWTGPGDGALGPAIGLWQIEPATHDDLFENFLNFPRWRGFRRRLLALRAARPSPHEQLATTLCYAAAVARLIYYRVPEPLPEAGDVEGYAAYWKTHYNTQLGAGSVAKFVDAWARHQLDRS